MVDPGSIGDWLQASLIAAALSGLAGVGWWALHEEEVDRTTPQAIPPRVSTGATCSPARHDGAEPLACFASRSSHRFVDLLWAGGAASRPTPVSARRDR
jgi:hypothetical protein